MATEIRELPALVVGQDGVNPDAVPASTTRETWYVHLDSYGLQAGRSVHGQHGDEPLARVEVVMPSVLVGDPADIRADVAGTVLRHARRHLGPV